MFVGSFFGWFAIIINTFDVRFFFGSRSDIILSAATYLRRNKYVIEDWTIRRNNDIAKPMALAQIQTQVEIQRTSTPSVISAKENIRQ